MHKLRWVQGALIIQKKRRKLLKNATQMLFPINHFLIVVGSRPIYSFFFFFLTIYSDLNRSSSEGFGSVSWAQTEAWWESSHQKAFSVWSWTCHKSLFHFTPTPLELDSRSQISAQNLTRNEFFLHGRFSLTHTYCIYCNGAISARLLYCSLEWTLVGIKGK